MTENSVTISIRKASVKDASKLVQTVSDASLKILEEDMWYKIEGSVDSLNKLWASIVDLTASSEAGQSNLLEESNCVKIVESDISLKTDCFSDEDEILAYCAVCSFRGNSTYLEEHYRNEHHDVIPNASRFCSDMCEICERTCESYYDKRKHRRTHINFDGSLNDWSKRILSSKGVLLSVPPKKENTQSNAKLVNVPEYANGMELLSSVIVRKEMEEASSEDVDAFCDLCGLHTVLSEIQQHYQERHSHGVSECSLCEFSFSSIAFCKKHATSSHPNQQVKIRRNNVEISEFICENCDKDFLTSEYLKTHMASRHANESPERCRFAYNCQMCNFGSSLYNDIIKHIKEDHDAPDLCPLCQTPFRDVDKLANHLKKMHPNADYHQFEKLCVKVEGHKCNECEKEFKELRLLNVHIKRVHKKEVRYVCDVCQKGFFEHSKMRDHKLTHLSEEAKVEKMKFECRFCKRKFNKLANLKQHENSHTGNKEYVCSLCNRGFAWITELRKHMISHSRERPFKCNMCYKSFKVKNRLESHMIIHTQKSKFNCEFCGKAFTVQATLKKHHCKQAEIQKMIYSMKQPAQPPTPPQIQQQVQQREATDDVSYMCGVCREMFTDAYAVDEHVKQHVQNVEGQIEEEVLIDGTYETFTTDGAN
ncbi:DgyrCDS5919 [Dimorphilus gyrociliatus]|uniref:DgyrCDS5919 n=1 Tax=Dimorphilus gyrociliatus TaxID=2664684 RepID=A0A7I8VLE7_9ANNE|nr:DgyrCDS5919 [Dimorphilus gyrociliatus]